MGSVVYELLRYLHLLCRVLNHSVGDHEGTLRVVEQANGQGGRGIRHKREGFQIPFVVYCSFSIESCIKSKQVGSVEFP
jgi:hypothetical protein